MYAIRSYYDNPETKALEDCGSVEVDSTGLAVFSVSHCSDYIISSEAISTSAAPSDSTTTTGTTNPKTNNELPLIPYAAIAIVSTATLVIMRKKSKSKIAE